MLSGSGSRVESAAQLCEPQNRSLTKRAKPPCPGCRRLQQELATYRAALEEGRAQLQELQATVQRLQEQLAAARKDSSTSSKPPSSDLVKPRRPAPAAGAGPRAPGGHPRHERAPFAPEQVQGSCDYRVGTCPDCGQALRPTGFGPHRTAGDTLDSRPETAPGGEPRLTAIGRPILPAQRAEILRRRPIPGSALFAVGTGFGPAGSRGEAAGPGRPVVS
jgi:hypothetical protein